MNTTTSPGDHESASKSASSHQAQPTETAGAAKMTGAPTSVTLTANQGFLLSFVQLSDVVSDTLRLASGTQGAGGHSEAYLQAQSRCAALADGLSLNGVLEQATQGVRAGRFQKAGSDCSIWAVAWERLKLQVHREAPTWVDEHDALTGAVGASASFTAHFQAMYAPVVNEFTRFGAGDEQEEYWTDLAQKNGAKSFDFNTALADWNHGFPMIPTDAANTLFAAKFRPSARDEAATEESAP